MVDGGVYRRTDKAALRHRVGTAIAQQVSCPRCSASVGSPCLGVTRPHKVRYDRAFDIRALTASGSTQEEKP